MVQGQQAPPGKTWTMKTFLLMYVTKSKQTSRHLKRKNEGQGTRARDEQNQVPPAENPVGQRAMEGSLHHPRQRTVPEGNPDPHLQGTTEPEVVPEGPLRALQEVGSPPMTAPTGEGDRELVLAPQNKKKTVPLLVVERHLEETHLHRTPPTTRASLAVKLQTRLMPIKSRG